MILILIFAADAATIDAEPDAAIPRPTADPAEADLPASDASKVVLGCASPASGSSRPEAEAGRRSKEMSGETESALEAPVGVVKDLSSITPFEERIY